MAFARLTDLCSWGPEGVTLLTSEDPSENGKAGAHKVKLGKKVDALKLLAQHTGVIGADVEVKVNNIIEEALALIEERRAKPGAPMSELASLTCRPKDGLKQPGAGS
ncbi:MAG: hypothetical protein KQI62_03725 [Deltaproteobacteria bacterium]|nr:hypothetical protein [Deltaproteobacteria bacterium]